MIAVIADDLSGAAELAGVALRHGLSAEVQTAFSPDTKADVICVDAGTRGLLPEKACEVVGKVAERVIAAKPAWIFKKCDSVLRGSVLSSPVYQSMVLAEVPAIKPVALSKGGPSTRITCSPWPLKKFSAAA